MNALRLEKKAPGLYGGRCDTCGNPLDDAQPSYALPDPGGVSVHCPQCAAKMRQRGAA